MNRLTLLLLGLSAGLSAQPPQPPVIQLPPPGIEVSQKDQTALRSGLDHLDRLTAELTGNPHLPDVLIFSKAVHYALDGNEFFHAEDIFRAKDLLRTGIERAEQLGRGEAPWVDAKGLVVRGYRSQIDGSIQPYGLVIPPEFTRTSAHRWRVDVWFHGRSDTLSEVNFLWERLRNPGTFTPRGTIVLHVYGRYCNASQFAGETDLFEALADVKKNFNVDENRILARGFSMGGASAWHIGAHYGTDFAAVAPGAGFAETAEYQKFAERGYRPSWWEEKLYHLTNATDYAANFFNVPVVAYNGDHDAQRQAADIMARSMEAEGLTLARVWGLNIGHAYTPEAAAQLDRMMDALAGKGRDPWPREVRFTTWTLKYNRMRWVIVDGMERHWSRARVTAVVEGDHTVRASTANVSAMTFDLETGAALLNPAQKITVVVDGQTLSAPGPLTDGSWTVHLTKAGADWAIAAGQPEGLRKRHDLQGPIDDAFMDRFLMVLPTGTPLNRTVERWSHAEAERAIREWRRQFRGDAPVKNDAAVTGDDIASSNLILWGDPRSNKVLARIASKLPLRWNEDGISLGARSFPSATCAPVLIYPNPLNPKKYVVINSGFTFRESAYSSNSLQVAMLPDYAVIDLTVPADSRWPGKVVAAGFFDENWQLQPNGGR
jgi:poly(3-hydroxybutyrate) depolymerase